MSWVTCGVAGCNQEAPGMGRACPGHAAVASHWPAEVAAREGVKLSWEQRYRIQVAERRKSRKGKR